MIERLSLVRGERIPWREVYRHRRNGVKLAAGQGEKL